MDVQRYSQREAIDIAKAEMDEPWNEFMENRLKQEVLFAKEYQTNFAHGTAGHIGYTLTALLAKKIEALWDPELIELLAAASHAAWMQTNQANGITSRISSLTNEEQMVPYAELSEQIKEYDRVMARLCIGICRMAVREAAL